MQNLSRLIQRFPYSPRYPKVISELETIEEIRLTYASIGRFGDGEINLIFGKDIYFQRYEYHLARRLLQVLRSSHDCYLTAILPAIDELSINEKAKRDMLYSEYHKSVSWCARGNTRYYSACISRPDAVSSFNGFSYFQSLTQLWQKRKVLFVCPDESMSNHKLFENAECYGVIQCTSMNAWGEYRRMLDTVLEKVNSTRFLVLLSVGPTATVLSYDLHLRGIQALDIGQVRKIFDRYTVGSTNHHG